VWDAAVVAAKAAAYAATLGAAGGVFFWLYSRGLLEPGMQSRVQRLVRWLALSAALASGVKILLTAGSLSGDVAGMIDPVMTRLVLQSGEGRAVCVRLLGMALTVWAMRSVVPSPWNAVAALTGAALAASSFAWVGHTHALAAPLASEGIVVVHLLAAAFWLGALLPLWLVCDAAQAGRASPAALASVVSRFGCAALAVVVVLLLAGIALLATLLNHASDLWSSGYGRWFLAKLTLVSLLLAAAAVNNRWLTPRLRVGDAGAARIFRRVLQIEMVLGSGILLATAAATTLVGPPV
jgi:putative copper resistance protein D